MITGEVSAIYKKAGRVRKVHLLLLLPDLAAAEKLSQRLGRLGNVASDGRPILGLDAKFLLELVLEIDPRSLVIPAHIWTPWFSVLGSKSGFDSLEECFEAGTGADLCPGDRAVLRPGHELAGGGPGPLPAGLQLRRPFPPEAGPGGQPLHRAPHLS